MIPRFTAEVTLTANRGYRARVQTRRDATALTPQQRTIGDRGGPLKAVPTVLTCPGCWTHDCGFLGLSTCLTCC